jgi:hypothetical protein
MEKERIITIVGIIIIIACCVSIFNNIKYEMSVSKDYNLNMKYFKSLAACKPVKVYIEDEDSTKEVVGKAQYTCGIIEDGKRCNFPMNIMPRLSNVSKKLMRAAERGDISTASQFDSDMVWIQDMYSKYCQK